MMILWMCPLFKICGLYSCSGPQILRECHYFGKVIDSIDGIILDRLDSYNLFLVKCLYGHGMVQSTILLNANGSETILANANLA